jgi:hypothetical protein
MSVDLISNREFMQATRAATLKALQGKVLQGKVKEDEMKRFMDSMMSRKRGIDIVAIGATASLTFALFYGVVKCEPRDKPWIFDEDVWGIGGAAIAAVGFMYTDNWDALFSTTAAFHVQGIAKAGGIYQINWFNASGVPIGQFNGPAGGIAIFEAGGAGKWKKK